MAITSANAETRFLVVGAGAIGGFIGACLSRVPEFRVTLIARGPHYHAMKAEGLKVTLEGHSKTPSEFVAKDLNVCMNLEQSAPHGPFDVVLLAVKAHQLIDIARDRFWKANIHAETVLVPLQNGLPWYMFLVRPVTDKFHGTRLKCVDPTGELEAAFESQRIVGCIAMPACSIDRPGHILHEHGWSFPLPSGPKAQLLADQLRKGGFQPRCYEDFEVELWVKIVGSAFFNPASALTGAVLGDFAQDPRIVSLTYRVMDEVRAVAKAVGKTIPVSNERRLKGAAKIGDHKTSMLQDVEAGKSALEVEALVGTVVEIAELTKTPVPTLSVVYDLMCMKQRSLKRAEEQRQKKANL